MNKLNPNSALKILYSVTLTAFASTILALISRYLNLDWKYWHTFLADGVKTWQPGGVYGDNWNSFQYSPFPLTDGLDISIIAILSLIVTITLGSKVSSLLLLTEVFKHSNTLSLFVLYFLPGYISLSFLMRLGTLFANGRITSSLILLTFAVILIYNIYRLWTRKSLFSFISPYKRSSLVQFLATIILFLVFLILSLQNGRNYMINDSNIIYVSDVVNGFQQRIASTIPLFGKQSDEYFYNLFAISLEATPHNALFWYWVTNAFGKLSAFFWIMEIAYFMIRKVNGEHASFYYRERFLVTLISIFLFFGSSAIVPSQYTELWGGSNPLIRTGHLGRYLIFIIPFWIVYSIAQSEFRKKFSSLFLGMVLLSGTSVTNLYFSVSLFLLISLFRGARFPIQISPKLNLFLRTRILVLAILSQTLPLVYLLNYGRNSMIPRLIISSIIILVFIISTSLTLSRISSRGISQSKQFLNNVNHAKAKIKYLVNLRDILIVALGLLVGAFLWGNSHGLKLFKQVYDFLGIHNQNLGFSKEPIMNIFALNFSLGNWSTCPPVTPACTTVSGFISFFGFFIFVNLSMGILLARGKNTFVLFHYLLFFIVQFYWVAFNSFLWTYGSPLMIDYWILARLLEIPFYFSFLIAGISMGHLIKSRDYLFLGPFVVLLFTWISINIEKTFIFSQFLVNLSFLKVNFLP